MSKQALKSYFVTASIAMLCLGAFVLIRKLPQHFTNNQLAETVQHEIATKENDLSEFLSSIDTIQLAKTNYSREIIKKCAEQGFHLNIYKNDSFIFWTDNLVALNVRSQFTKNASDVIKLSNGYFDVQSLKSGSYEFAGLFLLKSDYDLNNDYINNNFSFSSSLDKYYDLILSPEKGSIDIKNNFNQYLFSLKPKEGVSYRGLNGLSVLLLLIFYLALIHCAYGLIKYLANHYESLVAIIVLAVFVWLLKQSTYLPVVHQLLDRFDLFDPRFLASSFGSGSLGDLMISTLLWSVFNAFYFSLLHNKTIKLRTISGQITIVLVGVICFVSLYFFMRVHMQLIIDSVLFNNILNIGSISPYTLIGFGISIVSVLNVFLIFYRAVKQLKPLYQLKIQYFLLSLLPGLVLFVWLAYNLINWSWLTLFMIVWAVLFLLELRRLQRITSIFANYMALLWVCFLLSVLSCGVNSKFIANKTTSTTYSNALKLADERNFLVEYKLIDESKRIANDPFIKSYFTSPLISYKEIKSRIQQLYLKDLLTYYDLEIYSYKAEGLRYKMPSESNFNPDSVIYNFGEETSYPHLYFLSNLHHDRAYLLKLYVQENDCDIGLFFIYLNPIVFVQDNVYPELLLKRSNQQPLLASGLPFSIYENQKLLQSHGAEIIDFDSAQCYKTPLYGFSSYTRGRDRYYVYRSLADKFVIIAKKKFNLLSAFNLLSYIFLILAVSGVLTIILVMLYSYLFNKRLFDKFITTSFQNIINASLIGFVLFSFITITLITYFNFKFQYNQHYTEGLLVKGRQINLSIEKLLHNSNENDTQAKLNSNLLSLTGNNFSDINVYSTKGDLIASTNPGIFEKGILSQKINPLAFMSLQKAENSQIIEKEVIGTLHYLSLYSKIVNGKGKTVAYISLPYFAQSVVVNREISRFLVALVNVYMILFLVSGIIAFAVSQFISRPLQQISVGLSRIKLGKKNTPLQWNRKDEIGDLVDEYNKMIIKLEESTELLSRSEREGAWREMAKQIAHEIKNPLTPMKLSIQYLQRAIKDNNPQVPELTKKVNETLIEQIDHLTDIATAFSSFAKMPKPEFEIFELNDLLENIISLFREDNCLINFYDYSVSSKVNADRSQLISVFNNLFKNAIQSIPAHRDGLIEVVLLEEYGNLKIVVIDNGEGIDEDVKSKIFTPNFTTKNSGTGLGLAISKQIIEGVNGKIWFESNKGHGTSFYITIPLYHG